MRFLTCQMGGIKLAVKAAICSALLQSATGIKEISHAFNGVCWFFSTLFVLYLIYPALERMIAKLVKSKKNCYFLMVVCVIIAVAVHFIFVFIEAFTRFNGLSYESPYVRVWIFLLGMLIAYRFHFNNSRSDVPENLETNANCKEIITLVLFVTYWLCRNVLLLYDNFIVFCTILDIVIPAYMLYVFAFSRGALSKALNEKGIVEISKYSMFFYFIHYPIRMYLSDVEISNIGKVFIIFSATIALSYMASKIQTTMVRRF